MKTITKETKTLAKIEKAELGIEDHGIFGFNLVFVLGTSLHQGTGWYNLQNQWGGDFQKAILEAVGVRLWSELVGKTVYVIHTDDTHNALIAGIEKLPTETRGGRLIFDEFFEEHGVTQ